MQTLATMESTEIDVFFNERSGIVTDFEYGNSNSKQIHYMHVHFIASRRPLTDIHFPNMETVAVSNLYFDGTQ